MSSQAFLWFSVFLAVIFVISFLWGRKGKDPSRLSLRSTLKGPKTPVAKGQQKPDVHFYTEDASEAGNSKSLNVMFVYNGHTFDAYEVLGIPAGSSLDSAKKAFEVQALDGATSAEKRDFLQTAFTAIKISKSKA